MLDSASAPPMMVLCGACWDAVQAGSPCQTCGEPEPGQPTGSIDEEALLGRVGAALRAQVELAKQTANERMVRNQELYDQTLALRRRLRRQAAVMRSLRAEGHELRERFDRPLGEVDQALADSTDDVSHSTLRVVNVLLPRDITCGAVARRVLEDHLGREAKREQLENAMLVASELVTNAFLHGEGTIELSSEIRDRVFRVEIGDEGCSNWLHVHERAGHEAGGQGLFLVQELSDDWGAQTDPTRVWAEVSLTAAPAC